MAAPTSPFATLEHCFTLLTTGPAALASDGTTIHNGLPPRQIPLHKLRSLLPQLHPQAQLAAVDTLIRNARTGSATWQVGLAGVLLPYLRHLAAHHISADHPATAEAHALTWLHTTLGAQDPIADQRIHRLLETSAPAPVQPTRRDDLPA